ncbi:hypothetical protein CEV31_0788 [Brucella thiophenivorans]|uniref:Uncharacterized protein n=1 Tax=Brucella thiophenivorans TaxID=571255 RepID=A0A256G235_9HYPH|nr:hypothetical protein CEV31_0788 [Brucella thiophenivorans]
MLHNNQKTATERLSSITGFLHGVILKNMTKKNLMNAIAVAVEKLCQSCKLG